MGGGLMQLVAYGAHDIYLTGNPQITFFKVVYRRHTNFAMEAIEQTFNGSVSFGSKVSATISRNGDLVGRMYVEYTPNEILTTLDTTDTFVTPYLGHSLLKEIELEIGGQKIDKHYSHWLNIWSELTELNPSGKIGAIADAGGVEPTADSTLFQRMSYNHHGADLDNGTGSTKALGGAPDKAFVPLQFWFCRNPGLALPLIALQYHEVKVSIVFETAANLFEVGAGTLTTTSCASTKLWVDYIYLDTDERRRFAQVSHEYLIEQLQFNSSSSTKTHDLNFNHPVKELIWAGTPASATTSALTGVACPVALLANTTHLKLNGHDRFAARDRRYFTRTQVWQHHTGYGGVLIKDSIAVYSFALKPEEHQPSGTCNFSRIDNAQLILGTTASTLYIYAVNYNVLRIMSGMGGLAYSN
jgi:hypothetical protein